MKLVTTGEHYKLSGHICMEKILWNDSENWRAPALASLLLMSAQEI